MEALIVLVIWGLFAWLCAAMAKTRNRSELGWGIAGFVFGILAVIVLALIGKAEKS